MSTAGKKDSATERFFATVELVEQICLYLPVKGIMVCERINKHTRAVARGSNDLMMLTFRSDHPERKRFECYVVPGDQPYIRNPMILDVCGLEEGWTNFSASLCNDDMVFDISVETFPENIRHLFSLRLDPDNLFGDAASRLSSGDVQVLVLEQGSTYSRNT